MLLFSIKRLLRSVLEIGRTRLDILTLDIKIAQIRFLSNLVATLLSFFFFSIGTLLGLALILAIFWETHRILALSVLTVSFLGFGITLYLKLLSKLKNDPGIFEATLSGIKKDINSINNG